MIPFPFRRQSLIAAFGCAASLFFVAGSSTSARSIPATTAVLDSVLHDSSRLANHVVYVDFWASWCGPCKNSLPWMKRLVERMEPRGLRVVAITVDRKPSAARDFLDQLKSPAEEVTDTSGAWNRLAKSVVYDSTGTLAERYDLKALPSSFIYGRDGTLRKQHQGFGDRDTLYLDSLFNVLLAEKPAK